LLKIDQSFVRDITSDKDDAAITSAIIALTHNLGLRTIAGRCGDHRATRVSGRSRCDEVQGFLFSRPLSPNECTELLMAQAGAQR
jgi:EAL domain-containing protein (putative c-di-GMP-specific phosphodiesterase class I)